MYALVTTFESNLASSFRCSILGQLSKEESPSSAINDRATVVVDHDHRPIGDDLRLMRAGRVTAKVYQVTLDVDVGAGYEASKDRIGGWLALAEHHMVETLEETESAGSQCTLARSASDIRLAEKRGNQEILQDGRTWVRRGRHRIFPTWGHKQRAQRASYPLRSFLLIRKPSSVLL